jgi:DNA polymerase-3 subunit epsilon
MSTPWHLGRLLAFDTETTGIDIETDRIVTAAAILVGGGQGRESRNWLSDVDGHDIPEGATAVHHITTDHARAHGRPAKEVVEDVVTVLGESVSAGTVVVGHNVVYDLSLLDREARRHVGCGLDGAFDLARLRVVDTSVLDKHVLPRRRRVSEKQGARQLITLAQVYGFGWDEEAAHGSEYDALMAARIAYRIGALVLAPREQRPEFEFGRFQQFDQLAGLDIDALHAKQVVWAAEQAAGLEQHFRKTDPEAYVERAWPLVPFKGVSS